MTHAEMSGQGIVATERFLFVADVAADLLLTGVMDGVLVPCEVIWPAEDGVARLSGRRIDALTF